MRVLWICNLVINEFCQEYNISKNVFGGWISGMLSALRNRSEIQMGYCFPIIDEGRMKEGIYQGVYYYSYHASMDREDFNDVYLEEFMRIYRSFAPDIIYIYGTEYQHSLMAVKAAEKNGLLHRVVIHIQGLVSYIGQHYSLGLPDSVVQAKFGKRSIRDEKEYFFKNGANEKEILEKVKYVFGRTEWDRLSSLHINSGLKYYSIGEILRKEFYITSKRWYVNSLKNNVIFLSQASYALKGLHFLLEAVYVVKKSINGISVRIAGPDLMQLQTPYREYIVSLLSKLNLKNNVVFLGNLNTEEMIDEYVKASVFVVPSTVENSANSIGEAMMLGTPVIAAYTGGTPSLIVHRSTGLLYQCDAEYMLAEYIKLVLSDGNLSAYLSSNARAEALKRYDKNKIITRLEDAFREIMERENEVCSI